MQLRSLQINGFKSFADKTVIEFVPGLTGIVGPNGSGKSNITEAIRWCLGEQSAKSLRGERMGDVIFAGTADRKPLSRAEVTMIFDNSDGYLKQQPTEVTITRRLYRDGESEFYLNQQAVRLKDIVELFMDSGLGKESFAFISQGRVEAIFNSKPEQRRGIIEEAAGVYKYKQQKQKATGELAVTTDNLDRINDITHELKRQLEPLEEQRSLAKDYQRLSDQFAQVEQQALVLEITQLDTEQTSLQAEIQTTQQTLKNLKKTIDHLETQSDQLTAVDQELDGKLTAVNDEILTKSMKAENIAGAANVSSERAQNAQQTLADLNLQHDQLTEQAQTAQQQLTTLQEQERQLTTKRDALTQSLVQQQLVTDPKQLQDTLDAAQARYIDILQQEANTRNKLADLDKQMALSANQDAAKQRRLQERNDQIKQRQETVDTLQQAQQALTAQVKELTQTFDQRTSEGTKLSQRVSDTQAGYQKASGILQAAKARYETLMELHDDYAGFYAGVRVVLKQRERFEGLLGAIAELITVPKAYQQAFDLALGANLQAIATRDEATAKQAITWLKQQRAGRATFLPASVIRPRPLPANIRATLTNQPGFIGTGLELISFPDAIQPIMSNLVGSLIIVESLDAAVAIANLTGHRYRIVSLDGDILNPGGAMTGGQTKQQGSSPLARTQETKQLAEQITTMEAKLSELQEQLVTQQQALEQAREAIVPLTQNLNQSKAALNLKQEQLEQAQQALTQLQRQAAAEALPEVATDNLAEQHDTLRDQQQKLAAAKEKVEAEIEQTKLILEDATLEQADVQVKVQALQQELSDINGDLKALAIERKERQSEFASSTAKAKTLQQRMATIKSGAVETEQERANNEAVVKELNQALDALKQQQTQLTQDKASNRTQLSRVSAQITTAYQQRQQAQTDSEQQQVNANRIKINLDQKLDRLSTTYQTSYEAAKAALPDDVQPLPALNSQLKLLKRGLDDLGVVNLAAIEQYDEVKERFDFLTQQADDLIAAKTQLLATMSELDDEVAQRFKTTFDATNVAFQTIFPKMFGGGHAALSLTDPDDLLNTGLEITAQPPGKKLQRLSLLSGGERALTAIGLLFAIIQVNPVPFSILDEVEASLDEANVTRFGEFLRNYATDTQFIVITHRKGTMVAADMLYGVTMQESGVSKMMAVQLDQAHPEAQ
ncbi:chromosome segregation protein SMC [Lacticaseibacillus saniviri]|uniref:Chromosome partition protein Smc n=3 Tax=Lacticaseibacillus saniviri TaxID=931533 RepID=A0A0R2N3H8_9LACO|nr:chromosome segregation protein SMC [Lacticaseibacillus saniviri]KRO18605.1 chromosome segregation protein SMC [Lacticaseibacillus saniviri JCM 17471 = DSM 24301]